MRLALVSLSLLLLPACDSAEPTVERAMPVAPELAATEALPAPDYTPTAEELAHFSPNPAPPRPGGIGCTADEEAIFACTLENGKRVAVCSDTPGLAQYRYGGDGPELVLAGGELGIVGYSGGGESQIAFDNDGYRYVVFSRMVRTNFTADEPNYPAISDGVVLLEGERLADLHRCDDPHVLPVQYDAAERVWRRQDDLFTDETIRADPITGYETP